MTGVNKLLDSLRGRRQLMFGGGAAAVAIVLGLALAKSPARPPTPTNGPRAPAASPSGESNVVDGPAPSPAPSGSTPSGTPSAASPSAPKSPTVRVTLRVYPSGAVATVTLGRTRLGTITPQKPLVLERRRDSGPLDLVIRSVGFVPVHTRAYTFDDNTVEVRLTRLDKKDTIYGYREPLPPEDAGAAAAASGWVPLSSLFPSPPPAASSAPARPPAPVASSLPAVPPAAASSLPRVD